MSNAVSESDLPTTAFEGCARNVSDSSASSYNTAAIIYFWTNAVPASRIVAKKIQDDPQLKDVISVICVDNPIIRNYLLYPSAKVSVTNVPCFVVKIGSHYRVYSVSDANKVFQMAKDAYSDASTSEDIIDLPRSVRNSAARRTACVGVANSSSTSAINTSEISVV